MEKTKLTKFYRKSPIMTFIIAAILLSGGLVAAVRYWVLTTPGTIVVLSGEYEIALFADENCTIPLSSLDFGTVNRQQSAAANSSWVVAYVRLSQVMPEGETVFGHVNASDMPDGLTLVGQRYRWLQLDWTDMDINDQTSDLGWGSGNPTTPEGLPYVTVRFLLTVPPMTEAGTYDGFTISITTSDTSNNGGG